LINDSKPMPHFTNRSTAALATACAALLLAQPLWAERRNEGALLYDGVPATSEELRAALSQYRVSSETRLLGWLANGELLVATRFDQGEQVERLRAPGEVQLALSHAGGTLRSAATQPYHSQLLAYLADDSERGAPALYVQDAGGGSEHQLLPASNQPGAALFAHDGQRLAFSAQLAGNANTGIYVADAAGGAAPHQLRSGAGERWQVLGWTRSDRALLALRSSAGAANSDAAGSEAAGAGSTSDGSASGGSEAALPAVTGDELWLIEVGSGAARRIDEPAAPGGTAARNSARARASSAPKPVSHIIQARLANDDRGVYFLSDRDSDYMRLRYADLFGDAPRDVGPAISHDIEQFDLSVDGRYLAYGWNDNGYSRVSIIERPQSKSALLQETRVPGLPVGVVHDLQFARQGPRLAIDLGGSAALRDVYVYEPGTASAVRWTRSSLGAAHVSALVMPQTLRFPTWDRPEGQPRLLSAQLYRPADGARHPVLIMLAGRNAQARAQLDMFVQYLVTQLQLLVIVPDLRGASGHGRSFAALARNPTRNGESLDLGALLAWIGAQHDLRRERVALMGTGDGGELALAALGIYSDRLCAAISVDGVAGAQQLVAVRQPVLLLRGLGDPPLGAAAAEQLLWRLRSNAVEAWFVAPRETLGRIDSGEARLAAQQVMVQFLDKNLNGPAAPAQATPAAVAPPATPSTQ
jgi:dipeptidyl aminopeptidase/acylaminoacyl peptidase